MTRLERLARLRVKLATIERTRAGAHAGRLAARTEQVAALAEGYNPDAGASHGAALGARAAFAERLSRSGEALAIEVRTAQAAASSAERDVHRARKTVAQVVKNLAADDRVARKRSVRTTKESEL